MARLFIKSIGGYVVDVVTEKPNVDLIENGYQEIPKNTPVPTNATSGFYVFNGVDFVLDEPKLFAAYREAKAQANQAQVVIVDNTEKLNDIQEGVAAVFEMLAESKNNDNIEK